jgi:hypothetical protein
MRAILGLSVLAAIAVSGCASRDSLRALQTPAPAPQGVIAFNDSHAFRDAVAVEWIGGVSRWSYVMAEPNQRVIRPILQDALADSGLAAGTNLRARYGLRMDVAEARGPDVGAEYESELVATYVMVERSTGQEVWRREIATPGVGYFLSFNESDWQTAWFLDPILAVYNVANPLNYVPFASNRAADRARRQGLHGGHTRATIERFGPERAARANYAAVRTNISAFLVAFAADNQVEMIPILPCWGSPEEEARKVEIMASGGSFRSDDCRVGR